MNRKFVILTAVLLIVLISLSLFLTVNILRKQVSTMPFYVGVEFAYGNQFSQLKALVDKVKDYTNLFVMGSVTLSFNRTALDESCNYLYSSGLNFIVLIIFTPCTIALTVTRPTILFSIGWVMQHGNMAISSWAYIGLMSLAETSWIMESLGLSMTPL